MQGKPSIPEPPMKCWRPTRWAAVTGKSGRYDGRDIVQFMGYPDDMPVSNFRQVPSYKRMCICIMKNDYFCRYAGFSPTKGAIARRRAAVNKYRNIS